jgi:hypothetical protein
MKDPLAQQTQREFKKALEKRKADHAAGLRSNLFSHRVEIRHGDGSLFQLNYASMLESGPFLFVFTEHNGALGFHREDLESYQYLNNRFEFDKNWAPNTP